MSLTRTLLTNWIALAGTLAVGALSTTACAADAEITLGDFRPAPNTTLYIVKDSPATTQIHIDIDVLKGRDQYGDHVMIRAYDPDEKLFFREYFEAGDIIKEFQLGDAEIEGMNPPQIDPLPDGETLKTLSIPLGRPGVYQIRMMAGSRNSKFKVRASEPVHFGVSYQVGDFSAWNGSLKRAWAYIPPRTKQLSVKGRFVKICDADGNVLCDLTPANSRGKTQTLNIEKTGVLWQFDFTNPRDWKLLAWDMPLILCSDKATAMKIRASVEVLPDGTVVAHKFQRKIHGLIRKLLTEENIGRPEDVIPQVTEAQLDIMLQNPQQFVQLFSNGTSLFQQVNYVIHHQNTDPDSHWAGSLVGWEKIAERPAPDNRWDNFVADRAMANGISSSYNTLAAEMIWLATYQADWNPYYGNQQLINRAVIAALADLQRLGEAERFPDASQTPYAGGLAAFYTSRKTLPVYALASPYISDEVHSVWTDALEHVVDRAYPDPLVTCRNQSSHYLLLFDDFARGSGLPEYRKLAHDYALRFAAGASDGGYHEEACGPDATYSGMTHWHMAQFILQTRESDPQASKAIEDSLRQSQTFFAHTVGPEPDGDFRGACNFNHRTAAGFHWLQWSGARFLLRDELPYAAVWWNDPTTTPDEAELKRLADNIRRTVTSPSSDPGRLGMQVGVSQFLALQNPPIQGAVWPAEEDINFIRQFGDELIAVKRPGYFASIYVGKPAPSFYTRSREKLREPYPDNQESAGGLAKGLRHPYKTPLLGGGLSLLNNQDYGTAVYATNWSPLTYNGLVAVTKDHLRYWADYDATVFSLDRNSNELRIDGRIENQPIKYERIYRFGNDALDITLTVHAADAIDLDELFENIPILFGKIKQRGSTLTIEGEDAEGRAVADRITLRDNRGAGFDIVFDQPQQLTVVRNGLIEKHSGNGDTQVGRVQIHLPAHMKAGDAITLHYRFVPVQPEG